VTTLTRAAEAYDRHRYEEALRLASTVSRAVPSVAAVHELAGLAAYRAQRWPIARNHLARHFELTDDPVHLPLVMDCERARSRHHAVERTYQAIIEAHAPPEVLAEARIVRAESLADKGDFPEAIATLVAGGAGKPLRNPSYRHIRLWYALGDVSDRAGDLATAREMFARVVRADPEAYDATARFDELGAPAPRKSRPRRKVPVSTKQRDG
jgi:tetratricopeptide (TPR) repeat protein